MKLKEGQKVRLANTLQHGIIVNNECNGWYSVKFNDVVHRVPANELKAPFFDILKRLDSTCDIALIRLIKRKLWWLKPLVNLAILVSIVFLLFIILAIIL